MNLSATITTTDAMLPVRPRETLSMHVKVDADIYRPTLPAVFRC